MSWLQLDTTKLDEEVEKSKNAGEFSLLEAGVYELVLSSAFIDKTQSGTEFINFEFKNNDNDVYVTGWDVRRMIRNKEGSTTNKNGGLFGGIILLDLFAQQNGKRVTDLKPTQIVKEIRNEQKNVTSFNELLNKKYTVGIRHRKSFYVNSDYEPKESVKLEIVDVVKQDDKEAIEKLKAKIAKRPVLEDKKDDNYKQALAGSASTNGKTNEESKEIPF